MKAKTLGLSCQVEVARSCLESCLMAMKLQCPAHSLHASKQPADSLAVFVFAADLESRAESSIDCAYQRVHG